MRLIKVMIILGMTSSLVMAQGPEPSPAGQDNENANVGNIAAWNWDVTTDTVLAVTDSRGLIAGVDVDKDGYQEIWTSHYSGGGGVAGFEMINDTTLEMIYWDSTGAAWTPGTRYVQVGDVDNDGALEVIYFSGRDASDPNAGLYIVECTGDNTFAEPVFFGINSLGFVFNGMTNLTSLLVENFIVDDVDQDGWDEIIFASNRSSFITDYKDTVTHTIDTSYVVVDTIYVDADTSYVVADTTITPADTTTVVLADTTIITIIAADTTYIEADTTYVVADTTWIAADTTHTDVYKIDTYGHSEDFFGVLHATGDLQGGFHVVEPEFFTSARDIDMGQVDTSNSALFGWDNRLGGGSALSVLVADTDGDGLKELILHSWNYYNTTIVEATGPDTYSFGDTTYVRFTYPSDHVNLKQGTVCDIDGDGDDEVFMSNYSNGEVYMIDDRDGDATHFTADEMFVILSEELQAGLNDTLLAGFSIAAGNLDGDDMLDLYVASWSSKGYDIVDIEYGIGQWHYTPLLTDSAAHSQSGDFAITIGIADLDGDGHQELITGHQGVPDSIEVDGEKVVNPRAWTIRVTEYDPLFGVFGPLSTKEMRIITPNEYKLAAAYPNPFNPTTTIEYSLPIRKEISLIVYNIAGQEVVRLVDKEVKEAGSYQVVWNSRNAKGAQVASGTYIYVMKYGNFKKSHRVTLLK